MADSNTCFICLLSLHMCDHLVLDRCWKLCYFLHIRKLNVNVSRVLYYLISLDSVLLPGVRFGCFVTHFLASVVYFCGSDAVLAHFSLAPVGG